MNGLLLALQIMLVVLWYTVLPTASAWLIFLPLIVATVVAVIVCTTVTLTIERYTR